MEVECFPKYTTLIVLYIFIYTVILYYVLTDILNSEVPLILKCQGQRDIFGTTKRSSS